MPSGHTHEKINFILTLTVSSGCLVIDPLLGLGVLGGLGISCVITPDLLDVDGDPVPEYRLRKIPVIGGFYAWVFDIVARRIPHRGLWSHSPLGLLLAWVLLWYVPVGFFLIHWRMGIGLLLGWFVGHMVHILLDVGVSAVKRMIKWVMVGEVRWRKTL